MTGSGPRAGGTYRREFTGVDTTSSSGDLMVSCFLITIMTDLLIGIFFFFCIRLRYNEFFFLCTFFSLDLFNMFDANR